MSNVISIFGEVRIDTAAAEQFLAKCRERVEAGELLDEDAVLTEARNLITATLHPKGDDHVQQTHNH